MLAAQIALISLVSCISLYFYLARRHKSYNSEWVPAALVKTYLDKVDQDEREIRFRLFGIESPKSMMPTASGVSAGVTTSTQQVITQTDPAIMKELEALRIQLVTADARSVEFDKIINGLKAEKIALEEKLKTAPAAAATAGTAADTPAEVASVKKELDDLKAKLAEYEVIEDDLANLKKYQVENKTLQEKIAAYEKGEMPATSAVPATEEAVISATPTPTAPSTTTISGTPAEAPKLTVVNGGEESAPVDVSESVATTEATTPATPVPAATPAPAAAATVSGSTAEAPKTEKDKEEDLLSEFEKMLAS